MLDNLLSFWRRGANAAKKPTNAFFHPGVVISNTLTTVWIAYRGSEVKCARSQVRPFHNDDEEAHEHVSEHMRDLGERLLHEGDFSYEDVTGQDEPPVDGPLAPRENTATGPSGEGQMDVDPEARRRMRGKTRPIRFEQPTSSLVNASPDAPPGSSALAGSCDGHSLGRYLEARRKQAIGATCQGKTHH